VSTSLADWRRIWHELGAPAADEALREQLIARWSEPHRHYHTLQHLRECLENFDKVRSLAQRPAEIELALWFHDAFYDPARNDNEARSADWARASVLQAGLPPDMAARVHALVMATRHDATPEDADAQLLVDVDLAILGADARRFDEYERQVRAEYAHVTDDQFRQGRGRTLTTFVTRPRIYSTGHSHDALEERARENLRRALARLDGTMRIPPLQ
jgi:predicted metal-dependent HD superfamily phosphohydrolase